MTNSILEEVWAVKNRLDDESGGNIHVFCQQARDWTLKGLPCGIDVRSPSEFRAVFADKDRRAELVLREGLETFGGQED
jgi:hypothetical protein